MIPQRVQLQYLSECLTQDHLTSVDLEQFTEPWRTCYRIMSAVEPAEAYHELIQRIMSGQVAWDEGYPDAQEIMRIISQAADDPLQFEPLLELAASLEPVSWLWKNWIPRGMLSLLGAVPGAGKSYLALDLARRIIDPDEKFPDDSAIPLPGAPVIFVDAEAVPQLINERANSWQMDTSQLYLMLPEQYGYLDLTTPQHQDTLVTMAHVIQPELIIIDSLSSISTRGENNVEDVRTILSFLSQLAGAYKCGLLLIHHLRKRSALALLHTLSIDDFRGSGHIIAMARSVLGLSIIQDGPKQNRNGPRQLEIIKTNVGPYPPAMGIRFEALDPTGVRLQYGDPPEPFREPTQLNLCAEWLLDLLAECGETMRPQEIEKLADEDGYSRSTLYRSRKSLGDRVANTGLSRDPTNRWGTPEAVEAWIKVSRDGVDQEPVGDTRLRRATTQAEKCAEWLTDIFATNGDVKDVKSLLVKAQELGFSRGALYRARDLLDGQINTDKRGVWMWQR